MQLRSDKAFLSTRTRHRVDDKRNHFEKGASKGVCIRVLMWVLKRVSTLGKDDKHSLSLRAADLLFTNVSL